MTTTTTPPAKDLETMDRYAADLLSGRVFMLTCESEMSVRGDWVILRPEHWAHAVTVMGKMAGLGKAYAQVAKHIIHAMPLYQTRHELRATMYRAAAEALGKQFSDVWSRSTPEPVEGTRPFTLREVITIAAYLNEATAPIQFSVPGLGWVITGLARREGVTLPKF